MGRSVCSFLRNGAVALLLVSSWAGCGNSGSGSGKPDAGVGGPNADGGGGAPADASTPTDANADVTCAPPSTSGVCCNSCSSGSGQQCQNNGCYGGWYCDTTQCQCVRSAADCSGSSGGTTGGWPTTTGALACSMPATYSTTTYSGMCGIWRWSVKTGTDSAASSVNTTPVQTTIAHLTSLIPPSGISQYSTHLPRQPGTEMQVYELKNVHVTYVGHSSDSDNHMIADDGSGHTMIVEVPYPGCVGATSPFGCNITHARHTIDATFGPVDTGMTVDKTATIIGVGFFDFVHQQNGVAPNGVELHPVLALCFGTDCNPLAGL